MNANLVVVHACNSQQEAEMAKGALEAVGIASMIQADSAGGMRSHLAWATGGFILLVREEDYADGLAVLGA
jgi:hypothetical protein